MKNKILIASILLMCISIIGNAQQRAKLSGTVKDETGLPIIGAMVLIKGQDSGAVVDDKGRFTLTATRGSTLEISMMGYITEEYVVKGDASNVAFVLKEDAEQIDAVVVTIAYGSTLKKDLTGSVSAVDLNQVSKVPFLSFDQALQGRVAGMQISSGDGQPGSELNVVIRGANSLTQDNSPLYVVDGFPMEDFQSSSISSQDIASISVLKDASSTSLYGSRGANGVVIIETKKGKEGKPTIKYYGTVAMQKTTKQMEMMTPYEYVVYQIERNPLNFNRYLTSVGKSLEDYLTKDIVDWQGLLFRAAPMHTHNLSVNGGNKDTKYNASFNYADQKGVVINSGYQKIGGRFSFNQNLSKTGKILLNMSYNSDRTYGLIASDALSSSNSFATYLMYRTWGSRPFYISDDAGVDDLFDEDSGVYSIMNPYVSTQNEHRVKRQQIFNVSGRYEKQFAKYLTLRINGGYNSKESRSEIFNNSMTYGGYNSTFNTKGINGSWNYWRRGTWVNENTLMYWRRFNNKHRLDATIGVSEQGNRVESFGFSTEQIPIESLGMSGLDTGLPYTTKSTITESTMLSTFARINYDYKSKYYITIAARADGSSRFSKGNRWGSFPSMALAWRVSNERFMRRWRWISDAKLRASYGITGNNRVGDIDTYAAITQSSYYAVNGGSPFPTTVPSNIGNEELTWETTEALDLGMDISLFRERINLVLDLYRKNTDDLLMKANLPYSSGYSSVYKNVGDVQNEGLEISLNTINVSSKNFTWTTDFNIAFNRDKVIRLSEGQSALLSKVSLTYTYNSTYSYIAKVGEPIASFYGYEWDGVYNYDDFNLIGGEYVLKPNVPSNGAERSTIKPGDIKYVDQNGDFVVDDRDCVVIGRCNPIHTGGINNTFTYKNLALAVFFQWSYGNDILNANKLYFAGNAGNQNINQYRYYNDRWTPENTSSKIPSATGQGPQGIYSSYLIEDGSFLRLKNVQLTYNVPQVLVKRLRMKELGVSLSAQNLWTWTNYSGLDPEVSVRHSTLTPGYDFSAYARNRVITFSINCTF